MLRESAGLPRNSGKHQKGRPEEACVMIQVQLGHNFSVWRFPFFLTQKSVLIQMQLRHNCSVGRFPFFSHTGLVATVSRVRLVLFEIAVF